MPIGYRNGTATSALLRGGRRGATLRARRAAASRSPAGALPADSRFGRGGRLQIVRPPFARGQTQHSRQVVSGGGASHPSASGRSNETSQASGFGAIGNIARGIY